MDERVLIRWTPELEYIAVRIPDKMTIASLINEAKGERTMAQLAEACGVSASTLSRAVNGKITKPMTIDLIKTIADHAESKNLRLFEKLVRANGLMPKEIYESRAQSAVSSRFEERQTMKTKAQNIIMTELLKRGVSVKLVDWKKAELHSTCGQALPFDFAIETDLGQGTLIWSFMIIPYTLDDVIGGSQVPVGYYLRRAMQNMSGWFVEDAWEPEILEGRIHTFLFLDGSVYMSFEDTIVLGAKVNSDFSLMTLDMEKEKVNFEIYLRRNDGIEHELVFARKPVETNDDLDGDPWEVGIDDYIPREEDTECSGRTVDAI